MSSNQPNRGSSPSLPPWVKVFLIIFIVILALVIALHLMGFGFGSHRVGEANNLSVFHTVDRVRLTDISIEYPLQVALTYNLQGTGQ
jgi:flagellar basal body-associated protein FliL